MAYVIILKLVWILKFLLILSKSKNTRSRIQILTKMYGSEQLKTLPSLADPEHCAQV
jgi:hypothetical protein